ncbi:HET-domain-containing protein [Ophiobolus disseminans]|uniref:HET-domain-containing protein n=1 Tax=Ophiobolus disseminans TaxID=1469910 RepID=A0A6A6ZGR7_9PLEO|nr:HET-domain-containing protein [Ophiobolus disseminans]
MEPNTESSVGTRSLIVKLRYTPICHICVDVLAQWFLPEGPTWTWEIRTLKARMSECRCCGFLVGALDASSWLPYSDDDMLQLSTWLIGSQHITPLKRAYGDWKPETSSEHVETETMAYERHHRPVIQVLRKRSESSNSNTWVEVEARDRTTAFTILLPKVRATSGSEDVDGAEVFHGRKLRAKVNIELIRSWMHTCESTHHGNFHSHKDTYPLGHYERAALEVQGCLPRCSELPPDFHLVDVVNRCIIRVVQPTIYAALSYVWGNAKRLLLSKDNEEHLFTPGAFSANRTDVPRTFRDAFTVAGSLFIRYLWIDALCIYQDDAEQLNRSMESMDRIYGSAVLTIVSNTSSADTGIPGISLQRGPPQACLEWAGTTYLSTRQTFGAALKDSPWESRAWCLQEKIYSKRLLIFTEAQAFYHCAAATWFEDTVMEQKEGHGGLVQLREKYTRRRKDGRTPESLYTAYHSNREVFGQDFWSLVKIYNRRNLSFESDAIRAFSGILKSVEYALGRTVWGIPSYEFSRGITWLHSQHRMDSRREDFPSWSWAGWATVGTELDFKSCKRTDADVRYSRGRYRVRPIEISHLSVWTLRWNYHALDADSGKYDLKPVLPMNQPVARNSSSSRKPFSRGGTWELSSVKEYSGYMRSDSDASLYTWNLPDHPRVEPKTKEAFSNEDSKTTEPSPLTAEYDQTLHNFGEALGPSPPSLNYVADSMPPLSHIIRVRTSVATVLIAEHPKQPSPDNQPLYEVRSSISQAPLGLIQLDPAWSGRNKVQTLIYITRWCPEHESHEEEKEYNSVPRAEVLNVLLVESVEGWGEVKRRVQLMERVSLIDWRKAEPRWEVVSLA